jgi:DNA polymerase III delta prime subunit
MKRPRIRREVGSKKAKKRRRKEGDWIVDDDDMPLSESSETESHPLDAYLDGDSSSDAPVFDEVPMIDLPSLAYNRPNGFDMSNTIVLGGPSGSGKTAAVYACAAELEWEVFEVYPGVGKRSGSALDNLVGQVGRNHLVTKQGGRLLSPDPSRFFGASAAQIPTEPSLAEGSSDDTDIPDIGGIDIISDDGNGVPSQPPQADPPPVAEPVQKLQAQAKQSLILLEEVDILYRDDVNFWQTVINIIRDCRRPVILTCNGMCVMRFIA